MIDRLVDYVGWILVMLAPVFGLLAYRQWPWIGYTLPLLISAVISLAALMFITVRVVNAQPHRARPYIARCCALAVAGPLEQLLIALHTPFELQVFIVVPLFIGLAAWFIAELVQTG